MKHETHCPSCTDAQCWGDQRAAVLRTRVAALEGALRDLLACDVPLDLPGLHFIYVPVPRELGHKLYTLLAGKGE